MSIYENVPPQVYEVTWMTGHVEKVVAHQVVTGTTRMAAVRVGADSFATESEGARVKFHAEINGVWMLQLSAFEVDIRTIRNITNGEQTPGDAA